MMRIKSFLLEALSVPQIIVIFAHFIFLYFWRRNMKIFCYLYRELNLFLFAIVMLFAIILSRQVVEGRSDGKHGEHHRDGWRGQEKVPRPPPAAEPGFRPGRQEDLPSLATNLADEAAKLVADLNST